MSDAIAYHRLRAPRESGQTLVQPALATMAQVLHDAAQAPAYRDTNIAIAGMPLADFAGAARAEAIELARTCTAAYRDVAWLPRNAANQPILMAGHQPELFHPGVWFKNFALSALAAQSGAVPINLVVDNDTCRAASIRVPTGPRDAPRIETIPFDGPAAEIPHEERGIVDRDTFTTFAERVSAALQERIEDPLVKPLWRLAIQHADRTRNLGQTLAAARHELEASWGLKTLEVPLSTLCDTRSFARFALHLLLDIERFQTLYNQSLAEYRAVNHVRSHAHPVPNLHRDDDGWEAPLWIWTSAHPRRHNLFVERYADHLLLTNRAQIKLRLPLSGGQINDDTIAAWQAARRGGIKLRPKALLTTLYARLVLSDLFLHGIGGAKYDELTDALFSRYFDVPPPIYGTLTATLHLPVEKPNVTASDVRQLTHDLRELPFHPETYLTDAQRNASTIAHWIAEKQHWLALDLPQGTRKARHQAIVALNQQLLGALDAQRAQLSQALADATRAARQRALLSSREFSFCLYSAETLPRQLLDLSAHGL